MATLNQSWKETWNSPPLRIRMITGSILIFAILSTLPSFFATIEKRNGITLNDPILAAIPPHNVSWAIFSIIWGMALLTFIRILYKPTIYINYVWGLIFITVARVLTISLVPLNPPIGIVIISDPLTNLFYGEKVVTKDLFFSGHTAILVLTALCLERKTDKILAAISATAVGLLLLVQHAHYTLDVLAAPIFVYPLYKLSRFLVTAKSESAM